MAAWLGTAWAWALFAFAIGWLGQRLVFAILGAIAGLVVAVMAYYATDALLGVNSSLSTVEILFWSLVAVVVSPIMATAGWAGHRRSRWSILPGLTAPLLMVVDTTLRPSGPDSIRPWAQWIVYAAAAALSICLIARALSLSRGRVNRDHQAETA